MSLSVTKWSILNYLPKFRLRQQFYSAFKIRIKIDKKQKKKKLSKFGVWQSVIPPHDHSPNVSKSWNAASHIRLTFLLLLLTKMVYPTKSNKAALMHAFLARPCSSSSSSSVRRLYIFILCSKHVKIISIRDQK